jgi:hypothetical protein
MSEEETMSNAAGKPVVFISYAHESEPFRETVRQLGDWLQGQGCQVLTDHPHRHRPPPDGWPAWMLRCIREADTVLVVGSPKYRARYEKTAPPGSGQGATYEGAILTQDIYDASMRNEKFYPILPDDGAYDDIPMALRAWWNNHRFPSGNAGILALAQECAPERENANATGPVRIVVGAAAADAGSFEAAEPGEIPTAQPEPREPSAALPESPLRRKADRDFVAHARAEIARALAACQPLKAEIDKRLAEPDAGAAPDLVALLETVRVLETVVNDFLRPATIACLDGAHQEGDDFRRRWAAARAVLAWLAVLSVRADWVEDFERSHGGFVGLQVDIPVATGLGVEIVSSRYRQQRARLPTDTSRADLHGAGRFETPLMPASYALQKELDALLLHIWNRVFPEESRAALSQHDRNTLDAELRIRAANRTEHHYLAVSPGASTPLDQPDFLAALLKALPNLVVIRMMPAQGGGPLLVADETLLLATIRSFLEIPQFLRRQGY